VKEKESDIQRAICDYLACRKVFFWRQNTAPTFDRATQSYRAMPKAMPKYAMRGVPDIIERAFYRLRGEDRRGLPVGRPATLCGSIKEAWGAVPRHMID
jgi:hypothetical protein